MLLILLEFSHQISKCNIPIMQKFLLTGMSHAIYDKMLLCQQVHDKCCSVSDEIRISKLWNESTKPILSSYMDEVIFYIDKVMDQFNQLMTIDPRSMNLKYYVKKHIPVYKEDCLYSTHEEDFAEKTHFEENYDYAVKTHHSYNKITDEYAETEVNTKDHTHDYLDERHWDKEVDPEHRTVYGVLRGMVGEFEEFHTARTIECTKRYNPFWKDFIIVNQRKAQYCYDILDKMLNFDNRRFSLFIKNVKSGLSTIMKYKGSFYCSLCDAHQQKFIDVTMNQVVFQTKYCQSTLRGNSGVLKFLHIVFIEYADMLLQYISCYETDSQVYAFPFQNFLAKYKRRIPLIKKCFENLEEPNFMEYCWFLCKTYEVFNISTFFEGDYLVYKRIYLAIFSFMRKMNEALDEENEHAHIPTDNVDGLLIEPLNPSHSITEDKYYVDPEYRKDLLGAEKEEVKKYSKEQIEMAQKIFKLYNDKLGLADMAKLEEEFKHMEAKEKEKLMNMMRETQKLQEMLAEGGEDEEQGEKKEGEEEKLDAPKITPPEAETPAPRSLRLVKKIHLIQNFTSEELRRLEQKEEEEQKKEEEKKKEEELKKEEEQRKEDERKKEEEHKEGHQDSKTEELKKAEEKKMEEEKKEEEKKKQQEEVKKPEVSHDRVEPSSEIYDKNEDGIELNNLKLVWAEDGMNPVTHISLVDFDVDITQIIKSKFSKPEAISQNVIKMYLSFKPKEVNEFNHEISEIIMDADEMAAASHDYLLAKKKLENSKDPKEQSKHKKTIKRLAEKQKMSVKFKEDQKMLKKLHKKQKEAKLKALSEFKVEQNHHIDQEHYDSNFNGIQDMFVKLFGT